MNEVELGRAIQEARKRAGLTQQELCQKTGLSYSTLAKIERGAIKAPSVFTVSAIAAATGTDVASILGAISGATPGAGLTPGAGSPIPAEPQKVYKKSKSGISFIYFDINGVLVRFFQRAFAKLAEDSGTSSDVVEAAFWHYNDAVCRGEMDLPTFNRMLAEKTGLTEVDWEKYYLDGVEAIPEMHECLRWAAEYYRVGLMSNIFPGFIDAMIKRGLLPDLAYTTVIDSSEVGAIKPENRIFEIAQALAEVPPEEILMIDDSRPNLMAAEHYHWHVMWFDDYRPDESVSRVRTLLEF